MLQLLKNTKTETFNLFFRWGKIEHQGRYRLGKEIDNVHDAEQAFETKFLEKTGVLWRERFKEEWPEARYRFIDDEKLKKRIETGRGVTRRNSVDSNAEAERAFHLKPVTPKRSEPKPKEEPEQQPREEQQKEAREESPDDIKPFQMPEKDKLKEEPYLNILKNICFEINVLKETDFTSKKALEKMSEEMYNQYPKLFNDMKGKPLSDNNKLKEAFKRIIEQRHKQGKSLTETEP